jgi:hypothetical protein
MQYVDLWTTGDEYTAYSCRPEIDTRIENRQEGLGVLVIATELRLPNRMFTPPMERKLKMALEKV